MRRSFDHALIGATTVSLFDSKLRLRQGVHSLLLHPGKQADISLNSSTPGLPAGDDVSERLNTLLSKIDKYTPNAGWLDKVSSEAISDIFKETYMESPNAFIEVAFPVFGNTVVYADNMNKEMKKMYTIPSTLIKQYNQEITSTP